MTITQDRPAAGPLRDLPSPVSPYTPTEPLPLCPCVATHGKVLGGQMHMFLKLHWAKDQAHPCESGVNHPFVRDNGKSWSFPAEIVSMHMVDGEWTVVRRDLSQYRLRACVIQQVCDHYGWSQQRLAKHLGTSVRTMKRVETGEAEPWNDFYQMLKQRTGKLFDDMFEAKP